MIADDEAGVCFVSGPRYWEVAGLVVLKLAN
jgi:hypothetical protein